MRVLKVILLFALLFSGISQSLAQPFTLDENIKAVELKLKEDNRKGHEGEMSIITLSTVDSSRYYFVTGHELWQFLDILVTPLNDDRSLKVSLAQDNWEAPDMEKTSNGADKNGIISFKIRTWGSFGIKVESPENKTINFSIAVLASPPQQSYLGSPFVKIKESQMKANGSSDGAVENPTSNGGGNGGNTSLYILLGVAILAIGLLAGKLLGKKSASVIALLLAFTFPVEAQNSSGNGQGFFYDDQFFTQEDLENGKLTKHLDNKYGQYKEFKKKTKALAKKMKDIKSTLESIVNLYKNYKGLAECINSTPPANAPRIPSFCTIVYEYTIAGETGQEEYEKEGCAECFLEARKQFNTVRYLFEQLATIYKCNKTFSDAAIAFGDNVSGYHGVSGMAWQTQKLNIEKSVRDLQAAYDKKYGELLQSLADSMYELSECEARYGVEDWFDRFGYMYFEFMKDKYQRND
ncbi:MAG: hypothetical protein RIM83_02005 [Allomuricauda sp.]